MQEIILVPVTLTSSPKPTGAPRVEVPIEQIVAEIIAIRNTMEPIKILGSNT
jgi:hypothetical protein